MYYILVCVSDYCCGFGDVWRLVVFWVVFVFYFCFGGVGFCVDYSLFLCDGIGDIDFDCGWDWMGCVMVGFFLVW